MFFFFKQKRAYELRISDWSSDVCSSDLQKVGTSRTPIFLVLQSCLKQFQLMDLMRAEMDDKKLQPAQVMMTLGRHIHFKRKPIIERALGSEEHRVGKECVGTCRSRGSMHP